MLRAAILHECQNYLGGRGESPTPAPLVHLKIKIPVTVRRGISKRSHAEVGDCEQSTFCFVAQHSDVQRSNMFRCYISSGYTLFVYPVSSSFASLTSHGVIYSNFILTCFIMLSGLTTNQS